MQHLKSYCKNVFFLSICCGFLVTEKEFISAVLARPDCFVKISGEFFFLLVTDKLFLKILQTYETHIGLAKKKNIVANRKDKHC